MPRSLRVARLISIFTFLGPVWMLLLLKKDVGQIIRQSKHVFAFVFSFEQCHYSDVGWLEENETQNMYSLSRCRLLELNTWPQNHVATVLPEKWLFLTYHFWEIRDRMIVSLCRQGSTVCSPSKLQQPPLLAIVQIKQTKTMTPNPQTLS